MKKHILLLNWKDTSHPRAGGAERVTEILARGLVQRGYKVTLLCAAFRGAVHQEVRDGYHIIRIGNQYTVQVRAAIYWFTHLRGQSVSVIIDQIHGIPFFTPLYIRNLPIIAFIHEVADHIWIKTLPYPLNSCMRWVEPKLLRMYAGKPFLTISQSTKDDLVDIDIPASSISIIPMAFDAPKEMPPLAKKADPILIWIGRIAPVKQLEDCIAAYGIAHRRIQALKLWIIGSGEKKYEDMIKKRIRDTDGEIVMHGQVSEERKYELISQASLHVSTSLKEGFGIVVLEAAAYGVPTTAYDSMGIRDAILNGSTGVFTPECTPASLATTIVNLLADVDGYARMSQQAQAYSRTFNSRATVDVLERVIRSIQ